MHEGSIAGEVERSEFNSEEIGAQMMLGGD
jgi:hypothetical protein